ncbi:CRISPR-associated protein cas2 [Lactobacillus equicursoris 66c]|uniref:CRISPR-associated endoribonuclease Cas2 n=1 Tax=Lactobacillus equicursoris 66c TaxID=872326 RepID=K0NG46_9LACO|nr:CRISPR-associated endonuclease Cas2 [Lactobacillus equicursoris]CCK84272.1 CRISPR-associated protein cas2 [Lactobacillus equicursoris 66c]
MVLLLSFDLPRNTKEERKEAAEYRKRLVELGFDMKQYSLYEREVESEETRKHLIKTLKEEVPDDGMITLYLLPNEVNDKQITILGSEVTLSTNTNPKLIVI